MHTINIKISHELLSDKIELLVMENYELIYAEEISEKVLQNKEALLERIFIKLRSYHGQIAAKLYKFENEEIQEYWNRWFYFIDEEEFKYYIKAIPIEYHPKMPMFAECATIALTGYENYKKLLKEMSIYNSAMVGFGKALAEHYNKRIK